MDRRSQLWASCGPHARCSQALPCPISLLRRAPFAPVPCPISLLRRAPPRSCAVPHLALVPCSRDYASGSLKLFRLTEFATQDLGDMVQNGEVYAFAILGVLCGLLGAAFVHATASLVQLIRQLRAALEAPPLPPADDDGGDDDGFDDDGGDGGVGGAMGARDSRNSFWRDVDRHGRRSEGDGFVGRIVGWLGLGRLYRRCSYRRVAAALLSRYGYTLVVAFISALLAFPRQFSFFRDEPEEVG